MNYNKMTNEEKAREIIRCNDCEAIAKCDYKNTGVSCYSYGVAMKMAEWKDAIFEKKIEELERRI